MTKALANGEPLDGSKHNVHPHVRRQDNFRR